jgi:hypothetical protein
MADKWAYAAFGRLKNHDVWDWFGPDPIPRKPDNLVGSLYASARDGMGALHGAGPRVNHTHVIGFDGKNWLVGQVALPETFLDHKRYPPRIYNCDFVGREVHFLQGYQSASPVFPDEIPSVDLTRAAQLHERNIIPLWDRSVSNEYSDLPKTVTPFESVRKSVSLSDHLPPEAIERLREAHAAGKPIAVRYDPQSKGWWQLKQFDRNLQKETTESPKPQPLPQAAPEAERAAEQSGKSFLEGFKKMHPAGKTAIVGGSVALATLLGYWVYKVKHRDQRDLSNTAAR